MVKTDPESSRPKFLACQFQQAKPQEEKLNEIKDVSRQLVKLTQFKGRGVAFACARVASRMCQALSGRRICEAWSW